MENELKQSISREDIINEICKLNVKTQIEYLSAIKKQVISNLEADYAKKEDEKNKTKALLDDLKNE